MEKNNKMIEEKKENKDFITELDVTKFIASVHNRIKKEVGSDFVLAKLNEAEKEYIIERTQSAYKYKGNMEELKYKNIWGTSPTQKEINEIQKYSDIAFDRLMIKPIMMSIMNRNLSENYLLEVIAMKRKEMLETGQINQEGYNIGEQLMVNEEK